jgi:hypothetical protein
VLDLSGAALAAARSRMGPVAGAVEWIEGDVLTARLPSRAYDLWHDRAVFHFLTDPADRGRYVAQALSAVRTGGLSSSRRLRRTVRPDAADWRWHAMLRRRSRPSSGRIL